MNTDSLYVAGGVFHARIAEIKRRYGSDGMKRIYDFMRKKGYREPLDLENLKVKEMVPFQVFLLFLKGIEEVYGKNELRRNSRTAAKKKGIVGMIIKWAGSPDLLIRKASEYWPEFYSFGRLEGEIIEKGHGIIRGYNVSPEPFFCEDVLTEYFHGVMENLNLKNLEVKHTKCVHRGDEHCEWDMRWE